MKKFLIIGNQNALSYKEIFSRIKRGQMLTGYNKPDHFISPEGEIVIGSACSWFNNLEVNKPLKTILDKRYTPEEYPFFDNYPAINVNRIKDIPVDYTGLMGVPITVLDRVGNDGMVHFNYNYEVVAGFNDFKGEVKDFVKGEEVYIDEKHKRFAGPVLENKAKYFRIIIKKI